jgi:hypothetical protein
MQVPSPALAAEPAIAPAVSDLTTLDAMPSPVTAVDSLADMQADSQTEDESDDPEDNSGDLWQTVQHEFSTDHGLFQNVTRWTGPEGEQTLVANLRCQFQEKSRTLAVHLPIWPFLDSSPEVFCRVIDGPSAEVRTIQTRPNGIVVEITLSNPADSENNGGLILEIVAIASPVESATTAA